MKQRFSPVVLAMAATAVAFIALPILAILVRAPWSDAWDIVAQKTTRDALLVSLQTSVIAACIASIIGIPLSWVLARSSGRGISVLRTISIVPIVLPPVVGGIALLAAFGRRGVVGQYLYDWWGVSLPFTRTFTVIRSLRSMPNCSVMAATSEAASRALPPAPPASRPAPAARPAPHLLQPAPPQQAHSRRPATPGTPPLSAPPQRSDNPRPP